MPERLAALCCSLLAGCMLWDRCPRDSHQDVFCPELTKLLVHLETVHETFKVFVSCVLLRVPDGAWSAIHESIREILFPRVKSLLAWKGWAVIAGKAWQDLVSWASARNGTEAMRGCLSSLLMNSRRRTAHDSKVHDLWTVWKLSLSLQSWNLLSFKLGYKRRRTCSLSTSQTGFCASTFRALKASSRWQVACYMTKVC